MTNISSRFASKLIENLKEMYHGHFMFSDVLVVSNLHPDIKETNEALYLDTGHCCSAESQSL